MNHYSFICLFICLYTRGTKQRWTAELEKKLLHSWVLFIPFPPPNFIEQEEITVFKFSASKLINYNNTNNDLLSAVREYTWEKLSFPNWMDCSVSLGISTNYHLHSHQFHRIPSKTTLPINAKLFLHPLKEDRHGKSKP